MKHKTWFRLVLKAIGVLLIGPSLTGVVPGLVYVVMAALTWLELDFTGNDFLGWNWPWYLGAVLQFVAGLYLFFGGEWIVNKAIPSNRAYCPDCGYRLVDSSSANCSECGVALPQRREE